MIKGAVLYAKDLTKLTSFYEALGGQIAEDVPGEYVTLTGFHSELIVLQIPNQIADSIAIADPPAVRAQTPLKPIILVKSLEHALDVLGSAGGHILPDATPWHFKDYIVQDIVDPEGNVVQLWEDTSQ